MTLKVKESKAFANWIAAIQQNRASVERTPPDMLL